MLFFLFLFFLYFSCSNSSWFLFFLFLFLLFLFILFLFYSPESVESFFAVDVVTMLNHKHYVLTGSGLPRLFLQACSEAGRQKRMQCFFGRLHHHENWVRAMLGPAVTGSIRRKGGTGSWFLVVS